MLKKIIIFGFGNAGKAAFRFYTKDYKICAFCDNDDTKWDLDYKGVKVIDPSKLVGMNYDYIYIASHKAYEIYRDLISVGFEQKKLVIVPTNIILGQYDMPKGLYKLLILSLYFITYPFLWIASIFSNFLKSYR